MPLFAAFCGSFYRGLSPVMAADTAINLYTETREVPGSAKQVAMIGTPGLTRDATVATLVCRGWFTQDGRTWVVVGATLYERTAAATYVARGTVANDGKPVTFVSNGQGGGQVAIVGGGALYVLVLSTNVLSAITLPFANPVMITFLDGYGLINQRDTPTVWFSALENFASWDALDFFARSGSSDNLVGVAVSRDRVWALGSKTTTLFYNSGDFDTPFVPYPGTSTQVGLAHASLLGIYNDVLYWVAVSATGQYRMVRATDPTAETISTPPIEWFLSQCSTLTDATLLIYEQDGHPFVCVTCPSSPEAVQTYVYDVRESLWHARASWDSTLGQYLPWRASGATAINGEVLVGDRDTGDLYVLDLEVFAEDGAVLKRERATPYLSAEAEWLFIDQFELGMQAGVGLSSGQGSAPTVTLEISRDGARTWVDTGMATLGAGPASVGAVGDYTARAIWRRLGRVRADRLVFRVTQTDPVKTIWGPGAWIKATPGTGQL
ncbi:MAG: packaged DNA stabilization protein gp10 [Acidobacteriota bacterium]|nr:packaged DNA stabilization protein gp10 [Acidobacteriota bacterium]